MGTNLLLEGDDLEALLIRAHAQGGVNARIVRAEKVRQGGFLGFFARELFEVAVEIPDGPPVAATEPELLAVAPGSGADVGAAAPDVRRAGGSDARRTGPGATGPAPVPARRGPLDVAAAPTARLAAGEDGGAAVTPPFAPIAGDGGAAVGQERSWAPGERPLPPGNDDAVVAELSRLLAQQQPVPAPPAAGGLLGLAERVNAAERAAAAVAVRAATRNLVGVGVGVPVGAEHGGTGPGGGDAGPHAELTVTHEGGLRLSDATGPSRPTIPATFRPAFPGGLALGPVVAASTTGSDGTIEPAPGGSLTGEATLMPAGTGGRPVPERDGVAPSRGPVGPVSVRPGPTGTISAGGYPGRADDAEPPTIDGVPASPSRPAARRPEFTTLLDHLRSGTLPPRPRTSAESLLEQGIHPGTDLDAAQARQVRAQRAYQGVDREGPGGGGSPWDGGRPDPVPAPGPAQDDDPVLPPQARTAVERGSVPDRGHATERATAAERAAAQQAVDQRLAGDRSILRTLGVPAGWTRRMRGGDRFAAVLRVLERMPEVDIDPDVQAIAVIGPRAVVQLEAHRTALDLPLADRPRPVVVVPRDGRGRGPAITKAHKRGTVVTAIETDGYRCDETTVETLRSLRAGAVIAVVDAGLPTEQSQRWLDGLGQVDAIAVDNTSAVPDPASVLHLGLPVVRLDGIPVDRMTWTALLCAQLEAADPAR